MEKKIELTKLSSIEKKIHKMNEKLGDIEGEYYELHDEIESSFREMDYAIDALYEAHDDKVKPLAKRSDVLEGKMKSLEQEIEALYKQKDAVEKRITKELSKKVFGNKSKKKKQT